MKKIITILLLAISITAISKQNNYVNTGWVGGVHHNGQSDIRYFNDEATCLSTVAAMFADYSLNEGGNIVMVRCHRGTIRRINEIGFE